MNNNDSHKMYVMLSRTNTSVAKMIRKHSKCAFSHSSIAFDRALTKMYSFARRRLHNFLIAGFIKEDLNNGVYTWDREVPCELYEIEVSEETYNKGLEIIDSFFKHYAKHKYNILGVLAIKRNKVMERKYKYVCSQFVAHVLKESKAVETLPKDVWLMQPDDFRGIDQLHLIYRGPIKNVNNPEYTGHISENIT